MKKNKNSNNMQIQAYIKRSSLAENLKKEILDPDFMDMNPLFFQNFASLFKGAFSVTKEQVELLNIGGFLYFQSIMYLDDVIDEGDLSRLNLILVCQQEGVKILSSIFGLENKFWAFWNKRKEEYFQAVVLEKKLFRKQLIAIEEYENLACDKHSFLKSCIDSLHCIDNVDKDKYQKLLLSQKYFSVACQLRDDIKDFKEDLRKGQFNWAIYLLQQEKISTQDPEVLEKYFYIRGIADRVCQLGMKYCDKALDLVKNINVSEWEMVLAEMKLNFMQIIEEKKDYLELLKAQIILSNEFVSKNNS
ncbi:class 1 isoprenoid biosynthesis enzyme [Flavobacterium sp. LAR06]|uniref:class 1 isoprenoid biosynthesis enzyme n=1 Tax=Flavobacterium sp. LAR06 TaxID=3064897 RepID=UPI0035C15BB1